MAPLHLVVHPGIAVHLATVLDCCQAIRTGTLGPPLLLIRLFGCCYSYDQASASFMKVPRMPAGMVQQIQSAVLGLKSVDQGTLVQALGVSLHFAGVMHAQQASQSRLVSASSKLESVPF